MEKLENQENGNTLEEAIAAIKEQFIKWPLSEKSRFMEWLAKFQESHPEVTQYGAWHLIVGGTPPENVPFEDKAGVIREVISSIQSEFTKISEIENSSDPENFRNRLSEFLNGIGKEVVVDQGDLIAFWVNQSDIDSAKKFLKNLGYEIEAKDPGFPSAAGKVSWFPVEEECIFRIFTLPKHTLKK